MNDIEKALKEQDWCDAMSELGFDLRFNEEDYPDDFFFLAKDDSLIVLYRQDLKKFWTYSQANNKVLNTDIPNKKKKGE